jgi:dihydrofolate reductase
MTLSPRRSGPQEERAAETGESRSTPGASLALIVAVADNGTIGAGNRLPWRLPEDLRRFRTLTLGHAVIMGRKTWESLPHALPGRQNLVVSRQRHYVAQGAEVATSFEEALERAALPPPVFCIGGGELYRIALSRATRLYVTEVHQAYDGDTTFPAIDRTTWREVQRDTRPPPTEGAPAFSFVTYDRRLR